MSGRPAPIMFDAPAKDEKGMAYWGPNFNWCPDQDEGGIFLTTIQSMLISVGMVLQDEGKIWYNVRQLKTK